ncbi:MAG TPA: hypothetical protein VD969_19610 [Symbiobacteriaceae bacterium]|nr:hypothetical protein [Symbiobacteriaceae bacterium]
MTKSDELLATAVAIGRTAGGLAEQVIAEGGDMTALAADLQTLQAAAVICRREAERIAAQDARAEGAAPLCQRCDHVHGEAACTKGYDRRQACLRGHCDGYDPQ